MVLLVCPDSLSILHIPLTPFMWVTRHAIYNVLIHPAFKIKIMMNLKTNTGIFYFLILPWCPVQRTTGAHSLMWQCHFFFSVWVSLGHVLGSHSHTQIQQREMILAYQSTWAVFVMLYPKVNAQLILITAKVIPSWMFNSRQTIFMNASLLSILLILGMTKAFQVWSQISDLVI